MDDPDETGSKDTDSQGRLFLGQEYENKEVEFAVKILGDKDE